MPMRSAKRTVIQVLRCSPRRGCALGLEPGDRLLLFTDGMLERNTTSVDIESMVASGAEMHPREAVQHLTQAIFEATGGVLNDDATAMCLDWHGGPTRDRTSNAGSDR